ncbi:MAG: RtcB family protein [Elusimicrobiota bacterium]
MAVPIGIKKLDAYRYEIPKTGGMNVPGLIYTSEKMLSAICKDGALQQVANVAYLPGIIGRSLAMPDIHWGYGFPIGGVAAMDYNTGVISPGGIGYDINCGVRLIRTNLKMEEVKPKLEELLNILFTNIPSGVGSTGKINLSNDDVAQVLNTGAGWAVSQGYGSKSDLEHTEENGSIEYANSEKVSPRAITRGKEQLGTLGAGNHFIELQEVVEVYDEKIANAYGLWLGQAVMMIHTGSRGLGYQVCDDYLKTMGDAVRKYGISIPDRQLACAPVTSPEGKAYFAAMSAAANYAWANRQVITHWIRESFEHTFRIGAGKLGLDVVYDVAHNIGKIEEHTVNGKLKKVVIHRKGATRSFAAGRSEIPTDYRVYGQPVLVPGSMGTASYVLVGTEKAMSETWGSTCHGAGRVMSRTEALKRKRGEDVVNELNAQGIMIKSKSRKTIAEEMPQAYKDVNAVVDVCHESGIARRVARMVPVGVIKG